MLKDELDPRFHLNYSVVRISFLYIAPSLPDSSSLFFLSMYFYFIINILFRQGISCFFWWYNYLFSIKVSIAFIRAILPYEYVRDPCWYAIYGSLIGPSQDNSIELPCVKLPEAMIT